MRAGRAWVLVMVGGVAAALAGSWFSPRNAEVNPLHALRDGDAPPEILKFLRRSCYDCHSNETRWPWYSRLPPGSWMIGKDVKNGRRVMNFSEWSKIPPRQVAALTTAACIDLKNQRMPKKEYLVLHPEAKPNNAEVTRFCEWSNELVSELKKK